LNKPFWRRTRTVMVGAFFLDTQALNVIIFLAYMLFLNVFLLCLFIFDSVVELSCGLLTSPHDVGFS
jgi:hypothetical protein